MLKKRYNLIYSKATTDNLKEEDMLNLNIFYSKERNNRLLYNDKELQSLIVAIIMCLIVNPNRGTLDELYCSSYPFEFNKSNVLFFLHHHLNHPDNQEMQPVLFKYVSGIYPYGAGQRLMKLLCISLFNVGIYKDWNKIAEGAYGKVYQCTTSFSDHASVAIKKLIVAESIFDPCRLFDIFTEITALETFRMDGCVTHLFDYGVDKDYYFIVMKRYPMSLREWRLLQTSSFEDMLPTYLNIFKDILKAFSVIHNANTTHYDIKGDNIMLDFNFLEVAIDTSEYKDESNVCVKIADFGECKMFLNENDEHCIRNRGTNVIKSPEMLSNYDFQAKRAEDNYDRRKKHGTTRSSDIWSLGCLFYELLTGNYLFEEVETDYFGFIKKLNTIPISELISLDKFKDLNNNPYLIDFLKFMLVKDQSYRPNIISLIERFDHVHALLVTQSKNFHINPSYRNNLTSTINVNNILDTCNDMVNLSLNYNISDTKEGIKSLPSLIKITEDIYLAEYNFCELNYDKLIKLGVTHIISWTNSRVKEITERMLYLNIIETQLDIKKSVFYHIPKVIDFLRHCMVYRGIILFIDDYQFNNPQLKPNCLIRNLIVLSFSYMMQLSAYDAWTYLNSKLLFFWIPEQDLTILSLWESNHVQINNFFFNYPILRCLCGACVFILNRSYSSNSNIKSCNCSVKLKTSEHSNCCSSGCQEYLQNMKETYSINYEYLQWSNMNSYDFILGPENYGSITNQDYKKLLSYSRGLEENLIQHSLNEKKAVKLMTKVIFKLILERVMDSL